MITASVI